MLLGLCSSGKQLLSSIEAVTGPLPKHAVLLVEFSCAIIPRSLKVALAAPYIGAADNSNKTWHVG